MLPFFFVFCCFFLRLQVVGAEWLAPVGKLGLYCCLALSANLVCSTASLCLQTWSVVLPRSVCKLGLYCCLALSANLVCIAASLCLQTWSVLLPLSVCKLGLYCCLALSANLVCIAASLCLQTWSVLLPRSVCTPLCLSLSPCLSLLPPHLSLNHSLAHLHSTCALYCSSMNVSAHIHERL